MSRRDPLGRTTTTTYTPTGLVAEVVQADDTKLLNAYDACGRLLAATDAAGNITRYSYDAGGNQTALTDANGNTYTFKYDLLNRKTAMIYPNGSQEIWTYDRAGQLVGYTKCGPLAPRPQLSGRSSCPPSRYALPTPTTAAVG